MPHLLCVDDDTDLLLIKKAVLERAGYDVDACAGLEEALSRLDCIVYDAVLADWWFGKDNAMRLVRKVKEKQGTPVLIVSGFVEDALVSLGSAADYYLQKPVNADDLTKTLSELMARKQRAA